MSLPSTEHEPLRPRVEEGGALPLDSPHYIERAADREFLAALDRRDSLVLLKGARSMGKGSLLARGLHHAHTQGTRTALIDFQALDPASFETPEALYLSLAKAIAEQLDLSERPEDVWNARRGPNINFERYLRKEILDPTETPFAWGLDEVDLLFHTDFGSEVFGLFRSWHNKRSLDPAGPWARMTLAMGYSTEAHLFITDVNQSPFNVGTRIMLEDFTLPEVEELNRRYGSPLRSPAEIRRLQDWLGGHPFLVHRSLAELARRRTDLSALEEEAKRGAGPLVEHAKGIASQVKEHPGLAEGVKAVLTGLSSPSQETFYRLRSEGILRGETAKEARMRCSFYADHFKSSIG